MRYVIFSDVHGNILALKQMLQDLTQIDINGYIFCGDIIGYFDHAEEIIMVMQKMLNLIAVRGNHDDNYDNMYSKSNEEILRLQEQYGNSYSYELSENAKKYLNGLSQIERRTIGAKKVAICHGSISNPLTGRIYPDTRINCISKENELNICFHGHTHYRMDRYIEGVRVINPGSLGQPRDGEGFSYCIYDFKTDLAEFYNVNIDKNLLRREVERTEKHKTVRSYLIKRLSEE